MEFNGFATGDFDFFKKKDNMTRQEYDKYKNNIKLQFRSFCYEIQRLYHKNTNGVLQMNKDFEGFNKKSTNISIQSIEDSSLKLNMIMDCNSLYIGFVIFSNTDSKANYMCDFIRNNKGKLLDFMMASKHVEIFLENRIKNNWVGECRLKSFNANKNIDIIIENIKSHIEDKACDIKVFIGFEYAKGECIKQGKNFANIGYNAIMKLIDFRDSLMY